MATATVPQTPAAPVKAAAAPMSLEEATLEVCEVTGAALEKAAAAYQAREAQVRAINEKIPSVVEALVLADLIEPEEKEAAAKSLADPLQALELLKCAAQSVAGKQNGQTLPAAHVDGNGVPIKTASNGKYDRRSDFEKNRDEQFDRDLGIK